MNFHLAEDGEQRLLYHFVCQCGIFTAKSLDPRKFRKCKALCRKILHL